MRLLGDGRLDHLQNDRLGALAGQQIAPPRVEDLALVVHHLVVVEQALADLEVALLDLLLGLGDALADPLVVDGLAFLPADPGEGLDRPLGREDAHQVVVEAQEELAGPGVALPAGTAAQLVVDAAGLVPLGAEDVQAADLGHARTELDVGAAAGHVGRDGDIAVGAAVAGLVLLAGLGHDHGLAGVLLGVEHLVLEAVPFGQGRGQGLAFLDADRADEDRPARRADPIDLLDDRVELLLHGLVDDVLLIVADARHVRRDDDHVELVDLHELVGFGGGGAGHAGDLVVELEEILEGDRGERLRLLLDRDAFLGLDRLVQAVRPLAPVHEPARELVDDDDLVVHRHVVLLLLEDHVGPQALLDQVRPLHVVARIEGADPRDILGGLLSLVRQVDLLVVELDLVVLDGLGQLRVGRLQICFRRGKDLLGFLQPRAVLLAFGLRDFRRGTVNFALRRSNLGLDPIIGALKPNQLSGHLIRLLIAADVVERRTGNDQRRPRLVDQNRVHLVDDRVLERTLHHLLERRLHVVAEVVEAELVVGAVGDVALVLVLPLLAGGVHVRLDRADGQSQGLVDRPHPLGVAFGQVIVDRHDVDVASR